jgi:hypothetical protein
VDDVVDVGGGLVVVVVEGGAIVVLVVMVVVVVGGASRIERTGGGASGTRSPMANASPAPDVAATRNTTSSDSRRMTRQPWPSGMRRR